MWGIPSILVAGAVGAVFLALALAVGASPIFALLIFAIVAVALGGLLILRRGAEAGPEKQAAGRSTPRQPRSGGAPASGEGAPPAAGEAGMPPR